jgi:hypothetical protein
MAISGKVFTYRGKKEFVNPPPESCVLTQYEDIIEQGLRLWGQDFRQEYLDSTVPHMFPRQEGAYSFSSPQQNLYTGRESRT